MRKTENNAIVNKTSDPKREAGQKKMSFSHIPLGTMIATSVGMKSGVPKYGPKNWYTAKGHLYSVYMDGIMRHWMLMAAGEDYVRDTDGYVTHLDAIISGASVLKDLVLMGKAEDDRIKMEDSHLNNFAKEICGEDYANLPIKKR